ncbi:eukaryotic translation initiation factor 4E1 [Papilio machaon]|uniref:eukaryotic translation initiation factor 4E1 n=1 Tax=Papilio machaon TaxID=76193 RepID=UPI001E663CF2|nr:eukaryotic translation initiation factor 4E1 [Papilio machaon]
MKNDQIIESENIELSNIKHPLQNTWSFWMYTNTSKDWSENLVEVMTFDTVEDYWSIYHHAKTPSELPIGQDYAVFKKGIRPMWEDPANEQGGRWLLTLDRKRDAELDNIWLYLVLMLIGENLPHGEEICGVVVNVRPKCKVGVWVTNLKQKSANLEIGQKLKEQLPTNIRLCLHSHNSNQQIYSL